MKIKHKLSIPVFLLVLMMIAFVSSASADETGKTPAVKGEQPWMVGLVDSGTNNAHEGQFCGGSLIAPNWVLTAAHCLEGVQNADEVDVVIGRYQLSSNEGERIPAAEMAVHPGYPEYEDNQNNDIALIRLSRPATKGTPISLISAANEYVDDPGTMARVTGWGVLTEESEKTPDMLQGVNIPVVTQTACQLVYGDDLMSDDLCAGLEDGGADSCYGDSGGPLVSTDRNGNPVQIGIVSWGEGCGVAGNYGVYTRLTEYNNWINGVMAGTETVIQPSDIPLEFDDEWEEGDWDDDNGSWDEEGDWNDDDSSWGDAGWWEDDVNVQPVEPDDSVLNLSNAVLPGGFELVWVDEWDDAQGFTYVDDGDGYTGIYLYHDGFETEMDGEAQTINGVKVFFGEEDGEQTAVFTIDGHEIFIYSTISTTQLQQLVQSIIK